jgi:hypothetical protein
MSENVILVLPKIGQTLCEGEDIATVTLEVYVPVRYHYGMRHSHSYAQLISTSKTTKENMKVYLRAYGLGTSGKRDILLARLRQYAEGQDQWKRSVD